MKYINKNELIVNKSKFISYRYKFDEKNNLDKILSYLKQEHKKARHFCFAYVLVDGNNVECKKYNDDGEPKGTAGLPILNILEKRNLTNELIVVVRYFGGKKLGSSNLIRSYSKAANLTIE